MGNNDGAARMPHEAKTLPTEASAAANTSSDILPNVVTAKVGAVIALPWPAKSKHTQWYSGRRGAKNRSWRHYRASRAGVFFLPAGLPQCFAANYVADDKFGFGKCHGAPLVND